MDDQRGDLNVRLFMTGDTVNDSRQSEALASLLDVTGLQLCNNTGEIARRPFNEDSTMAS